ncbi:unnamed protein product, partial [Staurois parvus]
MEPTSSVRRPESGTWQSVAMGTAAMGGRTGTHGRLRAWQQQWEARNLPAPYDKMEPTSSVRRPESGTWQSVWRWRQQQWETVQGPMTHSGPGSSM